MKTTATLLLLALTPMVWAQNQGDEEITVKKKYVSAEGIADADAKTNTATRVSEWAGVGKEIGVAMHEGLNAVVDDANKFAGTPVGKFTMFLIAFKIIGDRVIHIVLGIPLYFTIMAMWFNVYRRMYGGKMVLTGENYDEATKIRTKTYGKEPGYKFASTEARAGVAWALGGFAFVFTLIMALGVIL